MPFPACYMFLAWRCWLFHFMYRQKLFPNATRLSLGNAGCFISISLPKMFPNGSWFLLVGEAGCFILTCPPEMFHVVRFLLGDASYFVLMYPPDIFRNAICCFLGDAGCFVLMYPPEMFPNSKTFLPRFAAIFFFTIAIVIFLGRLACRCLFQLAIGFEPKDSGCFNLIYPPEKFPHSQPLLVRLVCSYKTISICYVGNTGCFSLGILVRVSFKFWRPQMAKEFPIHWTDTDLVTMIYSA